MQRLTSISLVLIALLAAGRANATNKLWLAFDQSTVGCQTHTTNFFNCILPNTNFNALSLQYQYGEALAVGGSKALTASCAATDFQCVINNTGFAPAAYDIVMHFYGTGWNGGTNGTATVSVGGKSVLINTAWVETGNNCDGQTCTGAHEAYEAATDGVSADCCNGQYGHASCPSCQASCAQYAGNNGNPPWGCYSFSCGGVSYKMELLGAASNEFSAAGCTALTLNGPTCTGVDQACTGTAQCCSGLQCQKWSLSGQPPYSTFCCDPVGASCTKNTDCCGGSNCTGGKCACVPANGWCLQNSDCCSGLTCDTSAASPSCKAPAPPPGADMAGGGGARDLAASPAEDLGGSPGGDSADLATGPGNGDNPGSGAHGCEMGARSSPIGSLATVMLALAWALRRRSLRG